MSDLLTFAETELKAAGLVGPEAAYDGDVAKAVLELIKVFSDQGHSGGSAEMVTGCFSRLSRFQPLGPLTGAPEEWMEVHPGVEQNRRCPHIFRQGGEVMNIDGIIWREPSGSCYTNRHSRVAVTFPYTPVSIYKPSSEDPDHEEGEQQP